MSKTHICSLVCAAIAGATTFAAPLDRSKVAEEAKWVVHLDFDAFRKTAVGSQLTEKVLQPKLAETEAEMKFDLSLDFKNISSLTAYGPSFQKEGDGVLILSTTADVKKDLDTLVGMAALSDAEEKDVTMVQQKPYLLYNLKGSVFIAPNVGGSVLVAKSKEQIERGREVIEGRVPSLAKSALFKDYPEVADTFFFLGMAEGFNAAKNIPPQAQVLRETEGGRLVLGEKDKNLFVNLVFNGKNEESSLKIQQILQGLCALVSISQQNEDLTELLSQTKIASAGRNVSVDLRFPAAHVVEKILEKHGHGEHDQDENEEEIVDEKKETGN